MSTIRNEAGMSLVEGIIAAGLVAMTVLGMTVMIQVASSGTSKLSSSSCSQIAQSSLNRIQSMGYRTSVEKYMVTKNDPSNTMTNGGDIYGIPDGLRWPGGATAKLFDNSGATTDPVTIRNAKLINGSITALQSIYNSDARYCTSTNGLEYEGKPGEPLLMSDIQVGTQKIRPRIRIQPYSIEEGATKPCGGSNFPLLLRPEASRNTPEFLNSYFQFPPESKKNLGFLVTVFVTYEDSNKVTQNCQASEPFFYHRDDLWPTRPELTIDQNIFTLKNGNPRGECDFTDVDVTVRGTYAGVPEMEPGSLMLCQEEYRINDLGMATACDHGGPTLPAKVSGETKWGPCDALTICQKAPKASSLTPTSRGYDFKLDYEKLPWGCQTTVRMMIVDVAGNNVITEMPVWTVMNNAKTQPGEGPVCKWCATKGEDYCGSWTCSSGGGGRK